MVPDFLRGGESLVAIVKVATVPSVVAEFVALQVTAAVVVAAAMFALELGRVVARGIAVLFARPPARGKGAVTAAALKHAGIRVRR